MRWICAVQHSCCSAGAERSRLLVSQELLTTFNGTLVEVALRPNHAGRGTFMVYLDVDEDESSPIVIWDRKEEGRFPEAAELKQRVRDILEPERSLGHSDTVQKFPGTRDASPAPQSARSAVQRLLDLFSSEKVDWRPWQSKGK